MVLAGVVHRHAKKTNFCMIDEATVGFPLFANRRQVEVF